MYMYKFVVSITFHANWLLTPNIKHAMCNNMFDTAGLQITRPTTHTVFVCHTLGETRLLAPMLICAYYAIATAKPKTLH